MSLTQKVAINASAIAAGRGLLMVTGFVSVGVATRYLGLDKYGVLTTAMAFVGALAPLTDIGVSSIGARELAKRPAEERDRLIGGVLTLSIGLSLLSLAIGITAVHLVYSGADDESVRRAAILKIQV
jgi:O-antigen/teichoic acid export membrane protein